MNYADSTGGGALVGGSSARPRPFFSPRLFGRKPDAHAPDFLDTYYWWAYVEPASIKFFERDWLISLILFGNYRKLGRAALEALGDNLGGKNLQISCCYGDLTPKLTAKITEQGGTLDILDVMPAQIDNLKSKIPADAPVTMHCMNADTLAFPDSHFDRVILFFLLHEQPQEVRQKELTEALRVLKPGGELVIVDYGKPSRWHPLRYVVLPFLGWLEPFAIALWRTELADLLANEFKGCTLTKTPYYGGLYQRVVVKKH